MQIAIIGAGNVGSAIARGVSKQGHDVILTAADPANAQKVAEEVGGHVASTASDAVTGADLVVLAVPYGAVEDMARDIADEVTGKVVIDATNPLTTDGSGLAVSDRAGAETIQALLPGAHVVKAFNTVFASNQGDPVTDGVVLDGFYAGDDQTAKSTVAQLLGDIGFRPIDAGDLTAARALEHLAFLNISLNARNGWSWQSGWKLVGPTG